MAVEVRVTKCKLRDLRLAAGYTQEQLARLAGVAKARISEYEKEPIDVHISTAIKFCIIFNCSLDDLFEFDIRRTEP
jgi:DNA-binding XRE family transcriptional regulator